MTAPVSFLSLVTPSAPEPLLVSLAAARLQARVDGTSEDELLTVYLGAARGKVEQFVGRALFRQAWQEAFDRFPSAGGALTLSRPPIATDVAPVVKYYDTAGVQQTWSSTNYILTAPQGPTARRATISPALGKCYPQTQCRPDAVTVDFECGEKSSEANLPAVYPMAMLLLVGHWYGNREAVIESGFGELPLGVRSLLEPYKLVTLT